MAGGGDSSRLELTVAEAPDSDVGLGRARMDEAARRLLGVEAGDIIEIVGERQTLARVFRSLPVDEGKAVIRIDGLARENALVVLGGKVVVGKAKVRPAVGIRLSPIISKTHRISFGKGMDSFIRRGLPGRALHKGDVFIVPGMALMGGALPFMVIHSEPDGNVEVGEATEIEFRTEPFSRLEGVSPDELLRAFINRVAETLSDSLAEFEEEFAGLPNETGRRGTEVSVKVRALLEDLRRNSGP